MILAYIVLGVVALLLVVAVVGYNRLVRLRNEVDTGWSNIDVQLKRRDDLIPNLVEAVKGYAAHERGVFDEVTRRERRCRRRSAPAAPAQANDDAQPALGRLFAVAEAYPDLKASQNFLQLQDELTDTEDKIAAARRYYNATVHALQHRASRASRRCSSPAPLGLRGAGVLRGRAGRSARRRSPSASSVARVRMTLQQQIRANRLRSTCARRHRVPRPPRSSSPLPRTLWIGRERGRRCSHSGSPTRSSPGGSPAA